MGRIGVYVGSYKAHSELIGCGWTGSCEVFLHWEEGWFHPLTWDAKGVQLFSGGVAINTNPPTHAWGGGGVS